MSMTKQKQIETVVRELPPTDPQWTTGEWSVKVLICPPAWALCRNGKVVAEFHSVRSEQVDYIAKVLNVAAKIRALVEGEKP